MTTWVICGAGRGVGKTHLARRLCEVLPKAVYAKSGHGRRKPGGPANFFRSTEELSAFIEAQRGRCRHVVAESNALAREGKGDIVIFVGARPGRSDTRDDAESLRSKAHVIIGRGFSMRRCRSTLRGKVSDASVLEDVCDVLAEQQRHLVGRVPEVRSKVWFTVGELHAFGAGLARLLENIERSGTLREAARELVMSYRHAWNLLRTAEKHLGRRLIEPQAGGTGGGRTTLSDEGRHLLDVFRRLNRDVAAFADARFAGLYQKGRTGK